MRDYYAILGLSRSAGPEEIKSSYRRLVKKHHPDMTHDGRIAPLRIYEINEAYAVLNDRRRRAAFDMALSSYRRYRYLRVGVSLLCVSGSFGILVLMAIGSSFVGVACGPMCTRGEARQSLVQPDYSYVPWIGWRDGGAVAVKSVTGLRESLSAGDAAAGITATGDLARAEPPPAQSKFLFATTGAFAGMSDNDRRQDEAVRSQNTPGGSREDLRDSSVLAARTEEGSQPPRVGRLAGGGVIPLPETTTTRGWAKFSDPMLGFSFRYPRDKFPLKRLAHGSTVLVSRDGRAVVRLRRDQHIKTTGKREELQTFARTRYAGANVDITDIKGGFVLTGELRGEAFHERFIFSCRDHVAHSLLIVYPLSEKQEYAPAIAGIDGSYQSILTDRIGSTCSPPSSS